MSFLLENGILLTAVSYCNVMKMCTMGGEGVTLITLAVLYILRFFFFLTCSTKVMQVWYEEIWRYIQFLTQLFVSAWDDKFSIYFPVYFIFKFLYLAFILLQEAGSSYLYSFMEKILAFVIQRSYEITFSS